jgi:hypothetical protein
MYCGLLWVCFIISLLATTSGHGQISATYAFLNLQTLPNFSH